MSARIASKLAQTLVPYVPGEQPKSTNLIKLNTNENPYPPSPKVLKAIAQASDRLRLYPPPESDELRGAIAKRHQVRPEQVFVGNGSDEVLALSFLAFFDPDAAILLPDITYSFYTVYARLYGIPYNLVPLKPDYSLDIAALSSNSGGLVFANPNAPTGMAIGLDDIKRLAQAHAGRLVLSDEAYVEFGGESALPLTGEHKNLLVVKTFSKSHSLAGLRIGYALGDEALIETLTSVKNSFNSYPIDRLAQAGAAAAISDEEYYAGTIAKIVDTREWTAAELQNLGFTVLPSKANFLFASHPQKDAGDLMSGLREKDILVRRFDQDRTRDFLRITIGAPRDMQALIDRLKQLV